MTYSIRYIIYIYTYIYIYIHMCIYIWLVVSTPPKKKTSVGNIMPNIWKIKKKFQTTNHTYIYTYIHIYIHTYIHIYTHTYIHKSSSSFVLQKAIRLISYIHIYIYQRLQMGIHFQSCIPCKRFRCLQRRRHTLSVPPGPGPRDIGSSSLKLGDCHRLENWIKLLTWILTQGFKDKFT